MSRDWLLYLDDIIASAEKIARLTAGRDLEILSPLRLIALPFAARPGALALSWRDGAAASSESRRRRTAGR